MFVIWANKQNAKDAEARKAKFHELGAALTEQLESSSEFNCTNATKFIGVFQRKNGRTGWEASAIAVDGKRVAVAKRNSLRVIEAAKLMSVELVVDGETVSKMNRADQLVGAVAGAAIAGGSGAIIGGLSANRTTSRDVTSAHIKLLIDDNESVVRVPVIFEPKGHLPEKQIKARLRKAQDVLDAINARILLPRNNAVPT
ncbi:hypothetical protein [Hyphobacterium sp.]|uniref:hypothetical protein n=1 Tax=Hyphobacterium sp. TaxID=2004662 RepID=UPI003B5289E7